MADRGPHDTAGARDAFEGNEDLDCSPFNDLCIIPEEATSDEYSSTTGGPGSVSAQGSGASRPGSFLASEGAPSGPQRSFGAPSLLSHASASSEGGGHLSGSAQLRSHALPVSAPRADEVKLELLQSIQMLNSSKPKPSSTVPSHSSHRSSLASFTSSQASGLNGHTPHPAGDAWGADKDADKAAAAATSATAATPPAAAAAAAAAVADGDAGDTQDLAPGGDQKGLFSPLLSTSGKSLGSSKAGKKRVIPLRQVIQDAYEYHGLNELRWYFLFAVLTNAVLFMHWSGSTATFKHNVQNSFTEYANPDWQQNRMEAVLTMNDAVEYISGYLQYYTSLSQYTNWTYSGGLTNRVRVPEYADINYARIIVNIDSNCRSTALDPQSLHCYKQDPANPPGVDNLLEYLGWQKIDTMRWRGSTNSGTAWWAYTVVAPQYPNGTVADRAYFAQRVFGITQQTSLAWFPENSTNPATKVGDPFPRPLNCSTGGWEQGWPAAAPGTPWALADCPDGIDLKPYLARNAFSIGVDLLATNVLSREEEPDRALFTMLLQRTDTPYRGPKDRLMWQITTTLPVRTAMFATPLDKGRLFLEGVLLGAVLVLLHQQWWQYRVFKLQQLPHTCFLGHGWNMFELVSNLLMCGWFVYYVGVIVVVYTWGERWTPQSWTFEGPGGNNGPTHDQFNSMVTVGQAYNAWLYMGIIANALMCIRIVRYMRIHAGLHAFYRVFIIAAREFADFAVFLFYILLLLGSAIFAFFQITGGNKQFLRFTDGLSMMTELTFGFASYEEFQSGALGLGASVSAVTFLFWLAVLLLVVYTQNIILAIVAEAYERAKDQLGAADSSFPKLVAMRILCWGTMLVLTLRDAAAPLCRRLPAWCRNCGCCHCGCCPCAVPIVADSSEKDLEMQPPAQVGLPPGRSSSQPPLSGAPSCMVASREATLEPPLREESLPSNSVDSKLARHALVSMSFGFNPTDLHLYTFAHDIASNHPSSRVRAWARKYWAPWGVVRTLQVRSLMYLFQSFASYKLKDKPTWKMAREQAWEQAKAEKAAAGANPDAVDRFWYGVLPNMAMGGPNPAGYVDEEQLRAMLTLLADLQGSIKLRPPPFKGCANSIGENEQVVAALMSLYGVWVDAEDASTAAAVTAQGVKDAKGDDLLDGDDLLSRIPRGQAPGQPGQLESTTSFSLFGRLGADRRTAAAAAVAAANAAAAAAARPRASDMTFNLRQSQKATHQLEKLILKNQTENSMQLQWVTDQLEIHGSALKASSRALEQLLTRMETLSTAAAAAEGGAGAMVVGPPPPPGASSDGSSNSSGVVVGAAAGHFRQAGTFVRLAKAMVPGGSRSRMSRQSSEDVTAAEAAAAAAAAAAADGPHPQDLATAAPTPSRSDNSPAAAGAATGSELAALRRQVADLEQLLRQALATQASAGAGAQLLPAAANSVA